MNDNSERDPRLLAIPDTHGHAKGEHKPYVEERPLPLTARMLFLWFYHACRRGYPRFLMVADHMNYLTFEDPAAVNLVRRALKLAQAGDLYGAAETANIDVAHAAVVSEGLRRGMRYSIGAEVDNDPRSRPDASNIVDAMRPDAIIRSVHFVQITHPVHGEGWHWPFDNPEFRDLFEVVGTEQTWELYVTALIDAIERLPGNIVGHFFVPAVFGHWPDDAKLSAYEDRVLDAAAARQMAVEFNTRFLYRDHTDEEKQRYLAANKRFLRKAKARGVGIAIGSDAHSPKDQGGAFETVLALLDELDINEIVFPLGGSLRRVALRVERKPEPEPAPAPVEASRSVAATAGATAEPGKTVRKARPSAKPSRAPETSPDRPHERPEPSSPADAGGPAGSDRHPVPPPAEPPASSPNLRPPVRRAKAKPGSDGEGLAASNGAGPAGPLTPAAGKPAGAVKPSAPKAPAAAKAAPPPKAAPSKAVAAKAVAAKAVAAKGVAPKAAPAAKAPPLKAAPSPKTGSAAKAGRVAKPDLHGKPASGGAAARKAPAAALKIRTSAAKPGAAKAGQPKAGAAKTTAGKRAPAVATAKAVAGKASPRHAKAAPAAKNAASRGLPAKGAAKKPASKAAAHKPAATKAATKKAPAPKKSAAKKPAPARPSAKKPAPKKPVAKRPAPARKASPAKKPTAKKTATKRR